MKDKILELEIISTVLSIIVMIVIFIISLFIRINIAMLNLANQIVLFIGCQSFIILYDFINPEFCNCKGELFITLMVINIVCFRLTGYSVVIIGS